MEGYTDDATPEELVRSIESILSKSREKRRHRKSHGRISFGDLARAIADQWKAINPKAKEIFEAQQRGDIGVSATTRSRCRFVLEARHLRLIRLS